MAYRFSRRELANYAIAQLQEGVSPKTLGKRLAAALLATNRGKEAALLADDILTELEQRKTLAHLTITSATKLSVELKKSLTTYVKHATGAAEILTEEEVEPELIGGFKLETASRTWDKTIAKQLAEIKGGL